MKKKLGVLVIILGIISGIYFFNSEIQLNKTGSAMKLLVSKSGTSLAEMYSQDIREMNKGFCSTFIKL